MGGQRIWSESVKPDVIKEECIVVARSNVCFFRSHKHAARLALIAASFLLRVLPACAQTIAPPPEAAFLPLWHDLPQQAGWQMLVSPPFPAAWPPPSGGNVMRYAFAMRLDPAIADGVEMAAPWSKSTLSASGEIVVERLSHQLRSLGIQGVRPLQGTEIVLANREQEVTRLLLAGGTSATSDVVRNFTCAWISRQSVVAAAITPLHPDFVAWLACP